MKINIIFSSIMLSLIATPAFSSVPSTFSSDIQQIVITNNLYNAQFGEPKNTMTPTDVFVEYYNGASAACWVDSLKFQDSITAKAGPGLGCTSKINQIIIKPIPVVGKLNTYESPFKVTNIDTSKYITQIILTQDKAPLFDTRTGLVALPGTIKAEMQSLAR